MNPDEGGLRAGGVAPLVDVQLGFVIVTYRAGDVGKNLGGAECGSEDGGWEYTEHDPELENGNSDLQEPAGLGRNSLWKMQRR
jgi:hypothetical protein